MAVPLHPDDEPIVMSLVEHYVSRTDRCEQLLGSLRAMFVDSVALKKHVHSMKWRVKDPGHLRDKLARKASEARAEGVAFAITKDNLFEMINDLAGFRILHLYTRQFREINRIILEELAEANTPVIEGPIARTWDDESRQYFRDLGITTKDSETLYTSVHYVIEANRKTKYTAEIQVRTLAEELWGEVDHALNYPHESSILACREQIKVLARVTSSCTRLVDSIFRTHEDGQRPTDPAGPAPVGGAIEAAQGGDQERPVPGAEVDPGAIQA